MVKEEMPQFPPPIINTFRKPIRRVNRCQHPNCNRLLSKRPHLHINASQTPSRHFFCSKKCKNEWIQIRKSENEGFNFIESELKFDLTQRNN